MNIHPGIGIPDLQLGDPREAVLSRWGPPTSVSDGSAFYGDRDPVVVIRFDGLGRVELIELPYSGKPGCEVTLAGIQLTYRALEDVHEDLEAAGFFGRASDIGFEYPEGFAIWSMGSLSLGALDRSISADDDRDVVEGVSIGSATYFGD